MQLQLIYLFRFVNENVFGLGSMNWGAQKKEFDRFFLEITRSISWFDQSRPLLWIVHEGFCESEYF